MNSSDSDSSDMDEDYNNDNDIGYHHDNPNNLPNNNFPNNLLNNSNRLDNPDDNISVSEGSENEEDEGRGWNGAYSDPASSDNEEGSNNNSNNPNNPNNSDNHADNLLFSYPNNPNKPNNSDNPKVHSRDNSDKKDVYSLTPEGGEVGSENKGHHQDSEGSENIEREEGERVRCWANPLLLRLSQYDPEVTLIGLY